MTRSLPLLLCTLLCAALPAIAQVKPPATPERMNQLYAQYWEDYLRDNPIAATFNGDQRYNNRFGAATSAEQRAQSRALAENTWRAAPSSIRRRCRPKTASAMTCCAIACSRCSTDCASRPT